MRLHPGSVVHGTLHVPTLLRKFAELLAQHSAAGNRECIHRANSLADELERTVHIQDDDEDIRIEAEFLMDELSKKLNELCPPGYFFGTHPGDGSDFGVWGFDDLPEDFWHPNKIGLLA